MKIAVVGSGISGLSAAYYLSKKHHVDIFEKDDHFGGHSYTIDLTFESKQINSITWLSAQCFGTALLIYYIMARFALVPFLRWLEVLAARKVGKDKI